MARTGSLDTSTAGNASRLPTVSASPPDYSAHPILDPDYFRKDRHARVHLARQLRDHLRTDWHYSQLLNRVLHPVGEEHPIAVNERIMAGFLADASQYVRELMVQLPEDRRDPLTPDAEVEKCEDLRSLAAVLFRPGDGPDARRRVFEAQRKLYFTKLLIQIENTRMVQDGPRHQEYLGKLLDQELWSYIRESREAEARYTDPGEDSIASDKPETWRFKVRNVRRELPGGEYDVDIYHFDTRFKRESAGYAYTPGQGTYQVAEKPLYGAMERRRSVSILSKMLRKRINNPSAITDMLGAKFIVGDEKDIHRLVDLLHQVLGGPFLFRNQVDLIRHPEHHDQMNRFSSRGFRAFKEDIDIFYPAEKSKRGQAYLFGVELQILTVESFLRTVHSRDYVSHAEYKRRQFLQGVLPYVFPASIYQ